MNNTLKKKTVPFTQIENALLEDTRISFKAKGILAYMASRPDGWHFNDSHLTKVSTDGKDSLKNGILELIDAGWLIRTEIRQNGNRFMGYEYEIISRVGKAAAENPLRKSRCGKAATNNTDYNNTDYKESIPKGIPKKVDFSLIENWWNDLSDEFGLAKIKKITAQRQISLRARIKDAGGEQEFMDTVYQAIKGSNFLRGKNKRGWKADFTFILQEKSYTRMSEGGYQDQNTGIDYSKYETPLF